MAANLCTRIARLPIGVSSVTLGFSYLINESREVVMQDVLAALMGVVEGLTEFLPISSTGHLVLVGHFSGFENTMPAGAAKAFEIIIQLGAILAIVAAYPRRFTGLLRVTDNRGFSGLRGIGLLLITTIPASILGLLTHHLIKETLFHPLTVAAALAVGAVWILVTEYWHPRPKVEGVDSLTWREALSIGLFQCLSLWPGMSRAASTILGGMISGVERKTATEYSFFAAVPIMIAATIFELHKSYRDLAGHFQVVAIGFVVSFVVAWLAVKGFVWFLGQHTLVPFGWYRLALAAVVLWAALTLGTAL
ncbi:MAG: undecaprenyl-diphosphate phosphatase [Planctomycetaceae bacterium]|nr:undecaprenyl-diphosphate phosphatase [Planctomycetaceae bacterium]